MIYAGIDAGSRAIKIVLLDSTKKEIIASGAADQGIQQDALAAELLNTLLQEKNLSREDVSCIVATGYARAIVSVADTTITEITCHACGVHHLAPDARTVIEIGGQDSKILCLDEEGSVRDFSMNDRCAAGTGRFLEMAATRLEEKLEDLGTIAEKSQKAANISSMCVVFAETEIIGLLASEIPKEDIIAGVQNSIAARVTAMMGRNAIPPIAFTGGVAMIPGMREALESKLKQPIQIVPNPQMTGALGAAILASRQ